MRHLHTLSLGLLLCAVPASAGTAADPCAAVPVGPNFTSVICRLEVLGEAEPELAATLTRGADRATEARDLCARTYSRKAKTRLKQTERAVTEYGHRLRRLAASRRLDDAGRAELLAPMEALRVDVRRLGKSARCRDGAADVYALP